MCQIVFHFRNTLVTMVGMATILVTGITGTVMNPLSARLLKEGHSIIALVRPANGTPPEQRLKSFLCVDEDARDRLYVLPADITQDLAGVSAQARDRWHGRIDLIVHGAASIKFGETPKGELHRTNVFGTQAILRLARMLKIPEFHYVSTAYVGGDAKDFSETDCGMDQHHRNAYERSKAKAEQLVSGFHGRTSVYRIPIVVGDSQTGRISSFNGYYGSFAPLWQIRCSLLQRWKKQPEYGHEENIFLDKEGYVHIPLSIPCSPAGPVNLVPIDWPTDMLVELVLKPAEGKTFHLTHPNPPSVRDVVVTSLAYLGFRGITCGEDPPEDRKGLLGRIQQAILRGIKPYTPYTSKDAEAFGNQVAVQTLGERWTPPQTSDRRSLDDSYALPSKRTSDACSKIPDS